ncbi:hypothetical protein [Magnetofaba australis]|uniref:hypothetical protein n=1 Tax=Magnetofaba australis TaxID=1472297 RepID=UPI00117E08C5|nr:hypothetical protein [Magnetofaba australis]
MDHTPQMLLIVSPFINHASSQLSFHVCLAPPEGHPFSHDLKCLLGRRYAGWDAPMRGVGALKDTSAV